MNCCYEPAVAAKVTEHVNYITPVDGAAGDPREDRPGLAATHSSSPPDDVRKRAVRLPRAVAGRGARRGARPWPT